MLVMCAVQLLAAAWALQVQPAEGAAAAGVKLCGRKLSEIMSRVCEVYNSPSWDDPTVVEQPGAGAGAVRRRRQIGIADQCCTFGCTWEELNEYCAISSNSKSPLDGLEAHLVSESRRGTEHKRAAEAEAVAEAVAEAEAVAPPAAALQREVGGGRRRGYGRGRGRGRRCWCRPKRRTRTGRRRTLMGNMNRPKINDSPDPVVGTVSPMLTWGRTLNTDLPPVERDRYHYIAVYT